MDLIHFEGLNCYHSCIINAAEFLDVDYVPSFAALWSETDFSYDVVFNMYLTKKMPIALESLGIKLQKLPCSSKKEAEESFAGIKDGAWFTAGMDAFYMPWNQYYQTLNGYHYFLGQKEADQVICCFDPTYNIRDIQIVAGEVLPYFFDIIAIGQCNPTVIQTGVIPEAQEVINTLPVIQKRLTEEIMGCIGEHRKKADQMAKYADALYTNRCLYRHYLQSIPACPDFLTQLFSDDFLRQWAAIKYGLYKASLIRDNAKVLEQVSVKLCELIETEVKVAKKMSIQEEEQTPVIRTGRIMHTK